MGAGVGLQASRPRLREARRAAVLGLDDPERASDLLWVLPSLTCGYSSERRRFRVVREF